MEPNYSRMNQEVYSQLKEKMDALSKFGVQWVESANDPETLKHIRERHFSGGDVSGSKFSANLSDDHISFIVHSGELAVCSSVIDQLRNGADKSNGIRAETKQDYSSTIGNVGTDVLIKREDNQGGVIAHRNPDNQWDVPVYLKLEDESKLPLSSISNAIGGTYRPEEGKSPQAGLYTLFPGQVAPPMTDTKFWNEHGFLATKGEMKALADKLGRHPELSGEAQDVTLALSSVAQGPKAGKSYRRGSMTPEIKKNANQEIKIKKTPQANKRNMAMGLGL